MKLLAWVLTLCLLLTSVSTGLAEAPAPLLQARARLEDLGFEIDDKVYQDVQQMFLEANRYLEEAGSSAMPSISEEDYAYTLLMFIGMGDYDYDTCTWTPTSDRIYVFDAEFFNIQGMYTEFLQGVQSIATDAVFTDVSEDLSGMDEQFDGTRKVSFSCNGVPYTCELTSSGDWIDPQIIRYVNQALEEQNCSGQLHLISDYYDQIVFLIYGSEETAREMRLLLGTEETAILPSIGAPRDTLLYLITNLF
ncbi:MAG: hypothetical protein IKB78_00375 [Clostridia bacterium]|nr:hypothetical protein [Clostridia bacterium]